MGGCPEQALLQSVHGVMHRSRMVDRSPSPTWIPGAAAESSSPRPVKRHGHALPMDSSGIAQLLGQQPSSSSTLPLSARSDRAAGLISESRPARPLSEQAAMLPARSRNSLRWEDQTRRPRQRSVPPDYSSSPSQPTTDGERRMAEKWSSRGVAACLFLPSEISPEPKPPSHTNRRDALPEGSTILLGERLKVINPSKLESIEIARVLGDSWRNLEVGEQCVDGRRNVMTQAMRNLEVSSPRRRRSVPPHYSPRRLPIHGELHPHLDSKNMAACLGYSKGACSPFSSLTSKLEQQKEPIAMSFRLERMDLRKALCEHKDGFSARGFSASHSGRRVSSPRIGVVSSDEAFIQTPRMRQRSLSLQLTPAQPMRQVRPIVSHIRSVEDIRSADKRSSVTSIQQLRQRNDDLHSRKRSERDELQKETISAKPTASSASLVQLPSANEVIYGWRPELSAASSAMTSPRSGEAGMSSEALTAPRRDVVRGVEEYKVHRSASPMAKQQDARPSFFAWSPLEIGPHNPRCRSSSRRRSCSPISSKQEAGDESSRGSAAGGICRPRETKKRPWEWQQPQSPVAVAGKSSARELQHAPLRSLLGQAGRKNEQSLEWDLGVPAAIPVRKKMATASVEANGPQRAGATPRPDYEYTMSAVATTRRPFVSAAALPPAVAA